ncbi:MAG: peptidoglycan-binding domain-containing protein [Pseudodesulfovibrio sp.]|jgi:hypothetical protein|uniref:peptidoglycan-binding domain-containing protein n=1 Tax=Pseudodesulfovibrio sp. TaxID=2035812 RepID=UPI003D09B5C7
MRNPTRHIAVALLCLALATAGCVSANKNTAATAVAPAPTYQPMMDGELAGHQQIAALTLDLARRNILPPGPDVTLAKDAFVRLPPAPQGFRETGSAVSGAAQPGDGLYSLEMVRTFEDGYGRRSAVLDLAVYTLYKPDGRADKARAEALRADYVTAMRGSSGETRAEIGQAVADYQRKAGLLPDGVLGPQTAASLAASTNIQEFQALTSTPLYTASPEIEFHLMDESYGRNAPATYLNGYGSLLAVRQQAVQPEQYAATVKKGGQYLALVYFKDLPAPGTLIQMAFSSSAGSAGSRSDSQSPVMYAEGTDWPVIVTPVTLKNTSGSLYAHVLVNGRINGSIKLK